MRTQFYLQDWLKDKSQKVETRDGRPARIICTDAKADDGACIIALVPGYGGEEAYQFFPDGRAFSSKSSDEDCADLFLVTPEPKLTEFEERLVKFYNDCKGLPRDKDGVCNRHDLDELLHNTAAELLARARKQLQPEIDSEIAKADSIVYDNGVLFGKAEALKDLPRWRKCADCTPKPKYSNEWIFSIDSENVTRESAIVHKGYFLPLDGLEKLPGFKEEEK